MDSKDIFYLAQIENSIGRSEKAIELMLSLADQKNVFDPKERQLLVLVFKSAIDPIRESIRTLEMYILQEQTAGQVNLLKENKTKLIQELETLCNKGLDVTQKILLPEATDPTSQAFYHKLCGDFYRYMVEFADEKEVEKVKKSADEAYMHALDISKQSLNAADPTRLGVVLNYAVFKSDILKEIEDAKVLISDAIREFQKDENQLSDESQKEAINIVNVMQKNLVQWNPDKSLEEEEANEEEEEEQQQQQEPEQQEQEQEQTNENENTNEAEEN